MALGLGIAASAHAAEPEEPAKAPGLAEHVEVRLVTIDVVPLDREDRTVPGLTRESFRLFVDGKETPVDTVDAYCGDTPEPDPHAKKFGGWASPPDLPSGGTRHIVLVFDYLHLPTVICPELDPPGPCMLHTQALEAYRNVLSAKTDIHDEEIMVVALTGGLRIEQPFTKDRAAVVETLRRMEYDVTLWAGKFDQLTEYGFFNALNVLTTVLRATPGPKSMVLISAGDGPSNAYDTAFASLATIASDAQTRIYPVDSLGLIEEGIGPPAGLSRLATMTGGRISAGNNDFTLGYARARRDLGCHYTLGFYDKHPEENRTHSLSVESAVPGVRVHHAEAYSFPSQQARRGMALQAAFMVPSIFSGGGMRATVLPLLPHDRKSWDALLLIDFPIPASALRDGPVQREFGGLLTNGRVVAKKFARTVTLRAKAAGDADTERRLTFLEPTTLSPGTYGLTAALSVSDVGDPLAAHTDLTVPEMPAHGPFLVGPLIGRPAGPDVVILGGENAQGTPRDKVGGPKSFRPLLVTETDGSEPLFALTRACVFKKDSRKGPWVVTRQVAAESGEAEGSFDDTFSAREKDSVSCQRYLDEIPVDRLGLGAHTFTAVLKKGDSASRKPVDTRVARFLLTREHQVRE
jgi:VWFA-related protein